MLVRPPSGGGGETAAWMADSVKQRRGLCALIFTQDGTLMTTVDMSLPLVVKVM